ncbi:MULTISPECIES: hypothetical protein [Asticcacaulis]|uniref:hypothetical protein n=1 Tax=Asticcacaulis TaxID=76890 RepID=UPI001AE53CDD|nr:MULTISPECIES: hypothetical protein [Asticcacaulis]MBP2157613.1 hypothetical protein [Asticcacaulis solisilvae]MDR6798658.1 hypothetical protein [Asticcacaulis sp. BE141]
MKRFIHAMAGGLALTLLLVFWLSSAASEVSGDHDLIRAVKTAILYALPALIVCLVVTGGSGMALGGQWRHSLIGVKKRRMAVAAGNGLLILVPSAIFLWWKAQAGAFDAQFAIVQAAELLSGAANIVLLSLNTRDGLGLRSRPRRSQG